MMTKLNPKQKAFCEEYMIDKNATRAAIAAGYAKTGARVHACRMLTKPNIKAYIEKMTLEQSQRTQIDSDWVISELVQNHKDAKEMDEIGHSNNALNLIGKHFGSFNEDNKRDINLHTMKAEDMTDDELATFVKKEIDKELIKNGR